EEGAQFDLDAVLALNEQLARRLRNHSRAYATVSHRAEAWPEEQAVDLRVEVDPGPSAYYGPIVVDGNDRVRARYVLDELRLEEGQPYRLADFNRARQRLFALGVFNLVNVEPVLGEDRDPEVPVRVQVSEAPFHSF